MSIANLFAERVTHDGGFITNSVSVTNLKVRSVTTTNFYLELSKINGIVTCVIPEFSIAGYAAGPLPQAWSTLHPIPEEFRPEYQVLTLTYYALGSAPTTPALMSIIVFPNGIIEFTTNPINISLGASLNLNSYLLRDAVLTWQVME